MSNSLSQRPAKTIRPTKVRASVGSSTSGSSARPTRSVCAAAPRGSRGSSRGGTRERRRRDMGGLQGECRASEGQAKGRAPGSGALHGTAGVEGGDARLDLVAVGQAGGV